MEKMHQEINSVISISPFMNQKNLEKLGAIFSSSLGPKGRIKCIVNSAGNSIISCSSIKIVKALEFVDPCLIAITDSVKKFLDCFNDGGLTYGSILTNILILFTREPDLDGILDYNIDLMPILERNKLKFNITELPFLQSFIRGHLETKRWLLTKKEVKELEIGVLKAFLKSVPDDNEQDFGRVYVKSHSGRFTSEVYDGLLHSLSPEETPEMPRRNVRVLTLNVQLEDNMTKISQFEKNIKTEGHFYSGKHLPDYVRMLGSRCKSFRVEVLANQKVMCAGLQRLLKSASGNEDLIIIDRLGTKGIESLSSITGSSVSSSGIHFDEKNIGVLEYIDFVRIRDCKYLKFWSKSRPMVTLHVGQIFEDAAEDLQIICENALLQLKLMLSHTPYVLPGAGCLESSIMSHLVSQHRGPNKFKMSECYRRQALLLFNEDSHLAFVDDSLGHLWNLEREECQCGLLRKTKEMKFKSIFETELTLKSKNLLSFNSRAVIDSYYLKSNLHKLVLETAESLSNIESVVAVK